MTFAVWIFFIVSFLDHYQFLVLFLNPSLSPLLPSSHPLSIIFVRIKRYKPHFPSIPHHYPQMDHQRASRQLLPDAHLSLYLLSSAHALWASGKAHPAAFPNCPRINKVVTVSCRYFLRVLRSNHRHLLRQPTELH